MKIEIYRKRLTPFGYVIEDEPETVYSGIYWVEIRDGYIYGNISGEELTIETDNTNYIYRLSK